MENQDEQNPNSLNNLESSTRSKDHRGKTHVHQNIRIPIAIYERIQQRIQLLKDKGVGKWTVTDVIVEAIEVASDYYWEEEQQKYEESGKNGRVRVINGHTFGAKAPAQETHAPCHDSRPRRK